MNNPSVIWQCDSETFKIICETNSTYAGILRDFNLEGGKNYLTLQKRMKEENLVLGDGAGRGGTTRQYVDDQIYVEYSTYSRGALKKRIKKDGLLEYVCSICQCLPVWRGTELVLTLDHINGSRTDNRIENLRFVCPNCNSQLPTHCGKNLVRRKAFFCTSCGEQKKSRVGAKCLDCSASSKLKIDWPLKEELRNRIRQSTKAQVSRELGVTQATLAKHLRNERYD